MLSCLALPGSIPSQLLARSSSVPDALGFSCSFPRLLMLDHMCDRGPCWSVPKLASALRGSQLVSRDDAALKSSLTRTRNERKADLIDLSSKRA